MKKCTSKKIELLIDKRERLEKQLSETIDRNKIFNIKEKLRDISYQLSQCNDF